MSTYTRVRGGTGAGNGAGVEVNWDTILTANYFTYHSNNGTGISMTQASSGSATLTNSIVSFSNSTGITFASNAGSGTLALGSGTVTYRPGLGTNPSYNNPSAAWDGLGNDMDNQLYGTTKGYNSGVSGGNPGSDKTDLNGDGQEDILWFNPVTLVNNVWLMNGTTTGSTVALASVSAGWKMIGAADFNLDGKVDILWRNDGTGQNTVWLMNGTTKTSSVALDLLTDLNWKMIGTGDFNADGMPDILWRNTLVDEWGNPHFQCILGCADRSELENGERTR